MIENGKTFSDKHLINKIEELFKIFKSYLEIEMINFYFPSYFIEQNCCCHSNNTNQYFNCFYCNYSMGYVRDIEILSNLEESLYESFLNLNNSQGFVNFLNQTLYYKPKEEAAAAMYLMF